jgi:DNA-directed RNA polymerase subunit RPC12/RpoP
LPSGDISTNPGPVTYPCGKCSKPVKRNQRGIYCEDCTYWYHIKCIDLLVDEYQRLSTSSESWYCANCILPIFSNSFLILKWYMINQTHPLLLRCKCKQTHV